MVHMLHFCIASNYSYRHSTAIIDNHQSPANRDKMTSETLQVDRMAIRNEIWLTQEKCGGGGGQDRNS